MIKVAIADDHRQIRQAWAFILSRQPDITIVAQCSCGEEAINAVELLQPDVILMDINMSPMNGIVATRIISDTFPRTKIIGLSIHAETSYVKRMLEAGAAGYVTKNSPSEELVTAIHNASKGKQYICREIAERMNVKQSQASLP
ncbi:MAG TPA: response regulator transcription factor [Chitinophagaceae bacterium]